MQDVLKKYHVKQYNQFSIGLYAYFYSDSFLFALQGIDMILWTLPLKDEIFIFGISLRRLLGYYDMIIPCF
jgi:hypothetical protein